MRRNIAARQFENPGESADVFPTKDALENASITPGFEAYLEAKRGRLRVSAAFFRCLIRRRFLDVVDHDHVNRVLVVFQSQPKLFPKCGEKRR